MQLVLAIYEKIILLSIGKISFSIIIIVLHASFCYNIIIMIVRINTDSYTNLANPYMKKVKNSKKLFRQTYDRTASLNRKI